MPYSPVPAATSAAYGAHSIAALMPQLLWAMQQSCQIVQSVRSNLEFAPPSSWGKLPAAGMGHLNVVLRVWINTACCQAAV